jgi:hypothetical protein
MSGSKYAVNRYLLPKLLSFYLCILSIIVLFCLLTSMWDLCSHRRGANGNPCLTTPSSLAGADTRCLVSAISRRDLFFRPRSVASIPVPCPSTTATGLPAQQPCNAAPGEFPRGLAVAKLEVLLFAGCVNSPHGRYGPSSTSEQSLREIADSQRQESAPAGSRKNGKYPVPGSGSV